MDSQVGGAWFGCISVVDSAKGSDTAELPGAEPTGLSPLTSSLDHKLTLQEDNLPSTDVDMGIEDTWTEANGSATDYAIPLPPPPSLDDFVDVGADPGREPGFGIEHGPFLRPSTTMLNNLFESTDEQDDSTIGFTSNMTDLKIPVCGISHVSDVEVTTPAGVCGLRNLGNTCFMAAGLQCLAATPPVLRHFLDLQRTYNKDQPKTLTAQFASLLSKMWSGRYSVIRPSEFKQTLGTYHSQFKDYRQHDCQEFLALLLDSLHEQMNDAKTVKKAESASAIRDNDVDTSIQESLGRVSSSVAGSNAKPSKCKETYENSPSPECSNSPIVTMVGSPRDLASPVVDIDSIANSPRDSPLDDDEETLDSDEIVETKSSFIRNKMQEEGDPAWKKTDVRLDKLDNVLSHNVDRYHGLYDILKDAKTSNANFLVTPQENNNEIRFDSQKFPKENVRRAGLDNSNLTENHDFDNKTVSIKRIKEINVQSTTNSRSFDCFSSSSDAECDTGLEKCNVKRMRLDDQEKNHKRDGLAASDVQRSKVVRPCVGAVASQDEIEADEHWEKHLKANRSVIVDTFQGQFKSTVVCAVCKHVSVTYEPFMYLSVPLPRAMERQIEVTYVPTKGGTPTKCVVALNKQSRVGKLKEAVLKTLGKENIGTANVVLTEVLENHIARILDDNSLLKYVNDVNRSIYAFELSEAPDAFASDGGGDRISETQLCQNESSIGDQAISTCTICLEELDGDLKKHDGNSCNVIMCDACIENYFKNQSEPRMCPVCSTYVTASSFAKIDQTDRPRPAIRILNVSLVLRHDSNEGTNNRKGTKLHGYPRLVKLPSRVNAKDLYDVVEKVVPSEAPYTIHFVDGQGHHCSRCMYTAHCTGCRVPESGMVVLQNGETLAVRYTDTVPKMNQPVDHISISKQRPHHPLSLYDCLQAFTQSETLDEHNPWFCPKCAHNRCATKTLTVHRYPKFLIVYLKRFVFYECVSMKLDDKVTFPLAGLSIGRHLYDLYACVCHFGGVSAGHYTAYARNPKTDTWHYYNDEVTSKQKPQEEDFSNAYILFYNRQGTNSKPCNI